MKPINFDNSVILATLTESKVEFDSHISGNLAIDSLSAVDSVSENSLAWFGGEALPPNCRIPENSLLLVSTSIDLTSISQVSNFIVTSNPKYSFAFLSQQLFGGNPHSKGLPGSLFHPTATISPIAKVGENVSIGANSVVHDNVSIGANSVIGSNCTIGGPGFGFAKGPDGSYLRLPHIGGVMIGRNVEIGSNVCIDGGTFEATTISDYVKIDNLVHIAHNVFVGKRSLITACAEVSGSVIIGEDVWIAPNVSIIQKVSIGSNSLVGIGSVVTKDVEPGTTVFGSPARNIPKRNQI